MNEDDSINKIESIYYIKPKLLLSFQKNKNKEKKYITFNKIIKSNHERKIGSINFLTEQISRPKSSINTINEISKSNKEENFQNNYNKNTDFSHKKSKTLDKLFISYKNDDINISKNNFQNIFVKRDKIIYLLRKLFIILPDDKNQMYTKYYPNDLFFYFYFPIRLINSTININYIKNANKYDILCDDLNHILHEVYKYLKLSIYDSIKMEIYNEKFRPIIKESQLFINKIRIIYVKITNLKDKEIISWRKRVESKLFPIDDNYLLKKEIFSKKNKKMPILYRDVSTEYNKNDTRIITNYKNKADIKNDLLKKINFTDNNFYIDTQNLYNLANKNTYYITYSKESENENNKLNKDYLNDNYENDIIDNLFVSADENHFLRLKNSRKSLSLFRKNLKNKKLNTENINTQRKLNFSINEKEKINQSNKINNSNINSKINNNINNNYGNSFISKTINNYNNSNSNSNYNSFFREKNHLKKEKGKNKKKRNILFNLIKKNNKIGKFKNNLVSPLLFNFDVDDVINNKYILKYLTNKNKEKCENNIFQVKCRTFKIKNLNEDDSNSYRKKYFENNKIENITIANDENNENEKNKFILEKNKQKYFRINNNINEFINNDLDNLFKNEETDDFKTLNCNYILINELKEFPKSKLKKEFLFYVSLSDRIYLKYNDLINKIISILLDTNNNIKNIFLLNDFDNFLDYLEENFIKIKNNKMFMFRYIGYTNKDANISYILFILFIFYNKNLIEKKVDRKIIYLILENIGISFGSEINFQQYCDYKLVMTKNNYIIYNKKFNFVKDLILRVVVNEKFNKKSIIEKLNNIFAINIDDIKNIFKLDMCTVKLKKNIDIYNKVEKLYNDFLNYYSF